MRTLQEFQTRYPPPLWDCIAGQEVVTERAVNEMIGTGDLYLKIAAQIEVDTLGAFLNVAKQNHRHV